MSLIQYNTILIEIQIIDQIIVMGLKPAKASNLFGASPMMFWTCPAFVPPLKAKVATRTTTQITSRSGVATKDMRTMPRAGTRKARAVFTYTK